MLSMHMAGRGPEHLSWCFLVVDIPQVSAFNCSQVLSHHYIISKTIMCSIPWLFMQKLLSYLQQILIFLILHDLDKYGYILLIMKNSVFIVKYSLWRYLLRLQSTCIPSFEVVSKKQSLNRRANPAKWNNCQLGIFRHNQVNLPIWKQLHTHT